MNPLSIIPIEKINNLKNIIKSVEKIDGEIWECGVYKGGSAIEIAKITNKTIRLFDTFEGLPQESKEDNHHKKGDFSDVSYDDIIKLFAEYKNVKIYKGLIPYTFQGLESCKISFIHIDLDLYQSYLDCFNFVWPIMSISAIAILDDYNANTCIGAKKATDEFVEKTKCTINYMNETAYIKKD